MNQLEIFSDRIEPTEGTQGRTKRNIQAGVELSSRLEKQRTLTSNLLEKIVDYGNLNKAYKQVVGNGGSSGVDEMEVTELGAWLRMNLNELRTSIVKEDYQVNLVRKVEIPKPTGGTRTLGIPTVKDRLTTGPFTKS